MVAEDEGDEEQDDEEAGVEAWPPYPSIHDETWPVPMLMRLTILPLRLGAESAATTKRRMLRMTKEERWARVQDPYKGTAVDGSAELAAITAAGITLRDVSPVYFSPDSYHSAFEERLDIRRYHAYGR